MQQPSISFDETFLLKCDAGAGEDFNWTRIEPERRDISMMRSVKKGRRSNFDVESAALDMQSRAGSVSFSFTDMDS